MTDETHSQDFENKRESSHGHIKGWGIDADPKNDPTYPMKNRTDEEIRGYTWKRPPLQPENIEILRSVERKNLPAVFGTSIPPSGLSGMIRRQAFKYSESSYGRWLPLILADRIGVAEGIIDDLSKGIIPNIFAERGWGAEWKYNRQQLVTKVVVATVVTSMVLVAILSKRKKKKKGMVL